MLHTALSHRLALAGDLRIVAPPALEVVKPAPLLEEAAIGGSCGPCGGYCDSCMPDPIHDRRTGAMVMPPEWAPTRAQMANEEWVRTALSRGCLQALFSELTVIPAGGTDVLVTVQPSQRTCFVGLSERIVVISDLDPFTTVRALHERAFVGDCPQDFQNTAALTDFRDTDDCRWCPIPEADVGRLSDNTQYSRNFTNLSAGAAVRAQIGVRGIPYPDRGCFRGYKPAGQSCSCG